VPGIIGVLLVEDHKPLGQALKRGLEEEGFVRRCGRGLLVGRFQGPAGASYDINLLDLMLPKIDASRSCKNGARLASRRTSCCLTARKRTEKRVQGLDLGHDYLTKPFPLEELLARLRCSFARHQTMNDSCGVVHDLEIDTAARTVRRGPE